MISCSVCQDWMRRDRVVFKYYLSQAAFSLLRPQLTNVSSLWLNRLRGAGVWRCSGLEETKQARFTKAGKPKKAKLNL